ncbi:unnamed protein product [Ixodes pacificus]
MKPTQWSRTITATVTLMNSSLTSTSVGGPKVFGNNDTDLFIDQWLSPHPLAVLPDRAQWTHSSASFLKSFNKPDRVIEPSNLCMEDLEKLCDFGTEAHQEGCKHIIISSLSMKWQ